MLRRRRLTRDGFDPVGPLHPYVAWALVLLLDLLIIAAGLMALAWVVDQVEDMFWPGGVEWVEF